MQIPVGAPDAFTAEKFIDFVYEPEVQAPIEAYINYICPVRRAIKVLARDDPSWRTAADLPGRGLPREHLHLPRPRPGGGGGLDDAFQQVIGA